MNVGIFSYASEKEQEAKTKAFEVFGLDYVYGIEKVFDGEKSYSETVSELMPLDATDIYVFDTVDLGETPQEQLETLEYLEGAECNIHTIVDSQAILDDELNTGLIQQVREQFLKLLV